MTVSTPGWGGWRRAPYIVATSAEGGRVLIEVEDISAVEEIVGNAAAPANASAMFRGFPVIHRHGAALPLRVDAPFEEFVAAMGVDLTTTYTPPALRRRRPTPNRPRTAKGTFTAEVSPSLTQPASPELGSSPEPAQP